MSAEITEDTAVPQNGAGAEPIGPPPASVSARALPKASFTSSACVTYTAIDLGLQECSVLPDEEVRTLHARFSEARLSRYMTITGGNHRLALRLHAWNAALAGSLLPGLHLAEVTIRNFALGRLIANFKDGWYENPGFIRKLGNSQLAEELKKAVDDGKKLAHKQDRITSYLVRDLNFGFWVNIFTHRFHKDLWSRPLHTYNTQIPGTVDIAKLHDAIDGVRNFRNQVAHHKNLISKPSPKTVPERYQATLDVLGWLSPPAERHARAVCTFPQVWACCPIPHADLEKAVANFAVGGSGARPRIQQNDQGQ